MTLAIWIALLPVLSPGARDLFPHSDGDRQEMRTAGLLAGPVGAGLPSADADAAGSGPDARADSPPPVSPILPMASPLRTPGRGVDWTGLIRASGRFLAVEQAFRLATEPGTRAGLKGSYIRNYARAVRNLHGWSDGDEFYVNYVGHPMQGAVAGFLWTGSDRSYHHAEFGRDPLYWKSRLRAAGFAWVYSTQFEIGTVSEASIGAIQAVPPQQGFVDHVITPSVGLGWMMAEDALDKYLVKRIEAATTNRWIRLLARGGMNPARTFANVLQGSAPWRRDSREGITTYRASERPVVAPERPEAKPDRPGPAPAEFHMTFQTERLSGGGAPLTCVGGGGAGAFRIAAHWQLLADVGGCKILGLAPNLSGDSLAYMAGSRWVRSNTGPWTAHVQVLIGGHKLTEERLFPDRKKFLEQLATRNHTTPPTRDQYVLVAETNGLALAAGAGVHYKLSRALAIRVAEVSYRHSWLGPLFGRDPYTESVRLSSGLVLRMGTW